MYLVALLCNKKVQVSNYFLYKYELIRVFFPFFKLKFNFFLRLNKRSMSVIINCHQAERFQLIYRHSMQRKDYLESNTLPEDNKELINMFAVRSTQVCRQLPNNFLFYFRQLKYLVKVKKSIL